MPRKDVYSDHRGAFGEFGGESGAFIDRAFRERIVLVGVGLPGDLDEDTQQSLDELALLVDTAGADEVGRIVQRRQTPDPATYVGTGKVDEIKEVALATDCDTVVFDDELTPAQQRNLEKLLGRTAIDRTAVILDIFGQNAHSQEGKAQVELAMLRYRLPRLRGKGKGLSQQGGGIGTRMGGGETKLEVDRRRLVRRIHKLEAELGDIARHRDTQRKARRRSTVPHAAIVGYTNAGKSTLLNQLTHAGVLTEDRLFATLDATTRRMELPGGEGILVTDTVGFVRKLPHQLVQAFKSTLELVAEADLLVHVVDGSAPDPLGNIDAVRAVLAEIGAGDVPELMVFNKADAGPEAQQLADKDPAAVAVSAQAGTGMAEFVAALADRLRSLTEPRSFMVPYGRGDVRAAMHRSGEVLAESPESDGLQIRVRLSDDAASEFAEYAV